MIKAGMEQADEDFNSAIYFYKKAWTQAEKARRGIQAVRGINNYGVFDVAGQMINDSPRLWQGWVGSYSKNYGN